jgi:hypothetical protein
MNRRIPLAAPASLALLAACAARAPQAVSTSAPTSGAVALSFGWPDGFQMRVTLRHEGRRTGEEPTRTVVRHLVAAERRGDELWIFNRESQGEGDDADLELSLRIGEAMVQVVGMDGAFRRAEGTDAALRLLESAGADINREAARTALARMAAEDWELTAGAWRGQGLQEGQPRRKRFDGIVPLMPGVPATLDVEYGLAGRVPCGEGAPERRCVALFYRGGPATGERTAVLLRLRSGAQRKSEDAYIEDVSGSFEATLVTEPETLVPHRLTVREELRLKVRLRSGEVRQIDERSDDEYTFTREFEL